MSTDELGWVECVRALRGLEGQRSAVRNALRHRTEDLVAVFHGRLRTLAHDAKQPALFWPLEQVGEAHPEQPGIYLRERDFERAERRAGGILVIEQADLVLNLRPLNRALAPCSISPR
jgi:hypothetical protein